MRTLIEHSCGTLTVEFPDLEGLTAFTVPAFERRAFMVPLDEELKLRSAWTVKLVAPGRELTLEAEVVQRFDSVSGAISTAFEAVGWSAEKEAELARALAGEGETGGSNPEESGGAAVDSSETLGASPALELKAMNPVQRSILAAKAGRVERQILLRDTSPQVLQGLLANPRLEAKDVLRLVQSNHATAAILQRVANDARWGKNQEILTAVARNPKTPSPLAVRLMDKLRTPDLGQMGKMSSGLRENVRRAALREYLKRTQR